jgi:hypothetical protein
VLAAGDVVRANKDTNADLWVALKGGLNNFGVVTRISMRTFPLSGIWGGMVYYAPASIPQLFEAAVQHARDEEDQDTQMMTGYGFGMGFDVGINCRYQVKGIEDAEAMQRFEKVEGKVHGGLRMATPKEVSDELGGHAEQGGR